jgi:uncharacterized protein YciI
MLIAISKYLKPLVEVDVYRTQHIEYLKSSLLATNKLFLAGRQNPPVGAVIIVNQLSMSEFKTILLQDPYCIAGVAEYEIIEVNPGLFDETLRELLV